MPAGTARALVGLWLTGLAMTSTIMQGPAVHAAGRRDSLRITVLFNNVVQVPGLTAGWGFSCLVEGLQKTLLFDTGADGRVLLDNMRRLKLELKPVEAIFLSHIHADHTGGLDALLAMRSALQVFFPASFPPSFHQALAGAEARGIAVSAGGSLMDRVYSTGELGNGLLEQAMVVDTKKGLVVITGCAHPGITRIAEAAIRITGKRIHLAMGGFHLLWTTPSEIQAVIGRLKALGVEKVGPSHCTGDEATALFRRAWGEDFVEAGLGAVIEVPLP